VREVQRQIEAATLQELAQDAAELAVEADTHPSAGAEAVSGVEEGPAANGGTAAVGDGEAQRPVVPASQAVATAMQWGKEERGVVRAAVPGAEEIPLDEEDAGQAGG
jgi:hypothetical protein